MLSEKEKQIALIAYNHERAQNNALVGESIWAAVEAELATARENLAIANQRAVTLNAEMGRMADTIARLSAPVSDEEWDWNSLAHNADEWKGWFNTLIAARAKAKQ